MKSSPTKKSADSASTKSRRVKLPELYVGIAKSRNRYSDPYVRARIVEKRGYVYLTYREGKTVRTHYLGKAPKTSPTESAGPGAGPGRQRRRKKKSL